MEYEPGDMDYVPGKLEFGSEDMESVPGNVEYIIFHMNFIKKHVDT